MMTSFRKIAVLLLLLSVAFTPIWGVTVEGTNIDFPGLNVGDVIEFGNYEQDNYFENGPEPIEWIVLEIADEKAMIISKYGLDAVQFHNIVTSYNEPVNWEISSMRIWLNQIFYENAFSEAEKDWIVPSYLEDDSADRIFLLSVKEANAYLNKENRHCQATPYAKSKKIWIGYDGNCWWWLRTPGEQHDFVTHIGTEGDIHIYGNRATAKDGVVRPALWLNLKEY